MKLFIGGKWKDAQGGETFKSLDPGTGKALATVACAQDADVDAAVKAAELAAKTTSWATMPANDRAVILHRLADLIDEHRSILAQIESLDVGKPVAQAASFDIPHIAQTLRYYADLSLSVRRREPIAISGYEAYTARFAYGACAFIVPWNFPFLLLGWSVSPALAAGNTVVIKPSVETPLSALYFGHLAELAGIPPGVVNVVTGNGSKAGAALNGASGNPAHVVYRLARGGTHDRLHLRSKPGSRKAGVGRQGSSGGV